MHVYKQPGAHGLKLLCTDCIGYSHAESATAESKQVVLDKTVICNIGRIRYLYDQAVNQKYSVSKDFYAAVKNLPAAYDQAQYVRFIKRWGTVSCYYIICYLRLLFVS